MLTNALKILFKKSKEETSTSKIVRLLLLLMRCLSLRGDC